MTRPGDVEALTWTDAVSTKHSVDAGMQCRRNGLS